MIDEAAAMAARYGEVTLVVVGHTDGAEASQELGLERARAVARALQARGIAAARITSESRADREPLVLTPPGVREPQNRRVTIDIRG
jgi:outer membrane protein OmpA-like peptidoglycan-associated protein